MSVRLEIFVQCDHCLSAGPQLPIRVCPICDRHVCRDCGLAAAGDVVPREPGWWKTLARAVEMSMGSCPSCLDRSTAPQAVTYTLTRW